MSRLEAHPSSAATRRPWQLPKSMVEANDDDCIRLEHQPLGAMMAVSVQARPARAHRRAGDPGRTAGQPSLVDGTTFARFSPFDEILNIRGAAGPNRVQFAFPRLPTPIPNQCTRERAHLDGDDVRRWCKPAGRTIREHRLHELRPQGCG